MLKSVSTHTGCLYTSSIRLNLGRLSAEQRSALEQEIRSNPEVGDGRMDEYGAADGDPLARVRQDVFEFVAQSTRTAWTRSPSQVLVIAGGTEVVL